LTLRIHFEERLEEIRTCVVRMGGETMEMVRLAVEATVTGDTSLAERVIAQDDSIDEFERSTLEKTILVVLQEAPVAADLRHLAATIGILGEIEKAGDDAVKLARRSRKLVGHFPAEMRGALLELGEQSRRLFTSAIRLYTDYTPELAEEIIAGDEAIDTAYSRSRNQVMEIIRLHPEETEHLVRAIEAFHALEHVADHAVAIAHRMRMHNEAGNRDANVA
jgi:phosphate transport system protein